ncbi:MAG: DUF3568 family protein [Candidatus Omnitrophica bacterium]|nr:DUF3568 family protein [Candidatus Omnitrophota bacterium]MDD5575182.1 DUF3568 family protein [Candidatus Omnitrophota bacterium]
MLKKIICTVAMGFMCVHLTGCVAVLGAAAGGAGTATWLGGKLSQQVDASYEKTQKAARSSLVALKLTITRETVKDDVAQFVGDYTDGRSFWVDIRPVSLTASRVDVRVGVPGDQDASRKILDKIVASL